MQCCIFLGMVTTLRSPWLQKSKMTYESGLRGLRTRSVASQAFLEQMSLKRDTDLDLRRACLTYRVSVKERIG